MPTLGGILKLKTKFEDDEPDRFRVEWLKTLDEQLPHDAVVVSLCFDNPREPRTLGELTAALCAAMPSRNLRWIVRERDGWTIDCDAIRQVRQFAPCEWLRGRMWLRASWRPVRVTSSGYPDHLYYDAIEFVIPANASDRCARGIVTSDVFVVHGHDLQLLSEVTTELRHLGLTPVVLSNEVSQGNTVIEKLERVGRVGFAVVLLTPDDLGCARGEALSLRPRARQNVILELGYFLASLGRHRVCALHAGKLELPSDYYGVVYVQIDDTGSWRRVLADELRAAGLGRIEAANR